MTRLFAVVLLIAFAVTVSSFKLASPTAIAMTRTAAAGRLSSLVMKVPVTNDAFTKANRAVRQAGADDRIVELKLPLGLDLDEGKHVIRRTDRQSHSDAEGQTVAFSVYHRVVSLIC
jgi:hypothetical protein